MYIVLAILLCTIARFGPVASVPIPDDNSIAGVLNTAVSDVRDVILGEKNASHHQIPNILPAQIGIDAPYIFLHRTNLSRPQSFPFGEDLLNNLIQAMMPANSTAHPSLDGIANSPTQLAPELLLNQLLAALIPVLGAAPHENDVTRNSTARDHKVNINKLHLPRQ